MTRDFRRCNFLWSLSSSSSNSKFRFLHFSRDLRRDSVDLQPIAVYLFLCQSMTDVNRKIVTGRLYRTVVCNIFCTNKLKVRRALKVWRCPRSEKLRVETVSQLSYSQRLWPIAQGRNIIIIFCTMKWKWKAIEAFWRWLHDILHVRRYVCLHA